MASTFLKTLLIPAVIALLIYALFIYAIIPLYRRRQRYAQYLPVALDTENEDTLISRARNRVAGVFAPITRSSWWPQRRQRAMSFDTYFGDEELEEGMTPHDPALPTPRMPDNSQRRLSRDLEAGFRDDSDEEDDPRRRSLSAARD